jgi:hypothetical protein
MQHLDERRPQVCAVAAVGDGEAFGEREERKAVLSA